MKKVYILDTTYQYIIIIVLSNTMLHQVDMLWITDTHEKSQDDMYEKNKNGQHMVHGITYLFVRNYIEKCLRDLSEIQELIDIILCVPLMHIKKSINNLVMMTVVVGVFHYQQIQQQKHYILSVQPYILSILG